MAKKKTPKEIKKTFDTYIQAAFQAPKPKPKKNAASDRK